MADPHAHRPPPGPDAVEQPHYDPDHHASMMRIYTVVAVALAVCTASSFGVNYLVHQAHSLGVVTGFVLILGVAIVKAFLVGFYFMHLKWDWRLLYFIIVPVFILGVMMVIILMPDCVIGPGRESADALMMPGVKP